MAKTLGVGEGPGCTAVSAPPRRWVRHDQTWPVTVTIIGPDAALVNIGESTLALNTVELAALAAEVIAAVDLLPNRRDDLGR